MRSELKLRCEHLLLYKWSSRGLFLIVTLLFYVQAARLVVESQQLSELDDPIEALFQENSVLVFVAAAELALSRGNSSLAAHLFFCSGRYDLLLALLNNKLASEMVGDSQNTYVIPTIELSIAQVAVLYDSDTPLMRHTVNGTRRHCSFMRDTLQTAKTLGS